MMTVSSPAQLSAQSPIRELKKNKLRVSAKTQRSFGRPTLDAQREPQPHPQPVLWPEPQQQRPTEVAPALSPALGRDGRRSRVSKSAFFPCALGTIDEDAEYEEMNSPRASFGHPASVCSSSDGRDDISATKSHELETRNAELEARLLELEKKLADLAAAQESP